MRSTWAHLCDAAHHKARGLALGALIGVLVILAEGRATAYTIKETENGDVVCWRQERVVIHLDSSLALLGDPDEVEQAILQAIGEWEESERLTFSFALDDDASRGTGRSGDERNDIMALREWPYDHRAPAVTVLTFDPVDGTIRDADILFNASRSDWGTTIRAHPDAIDLQDVATHELGHLIGLAHSDNPQATMYLEAPRGSTIRRTLHADDLAALDHVFDATTVGGSTISGCSVAPTHGSPRFALLFGLLLLTLLVRARASGRRRPPL
jgi:MYXO-CTERM domain-containing protein